MSDKNPIDGLGFDKLVLAHLEKVSADEKEHMNIAAAAAETGITSEQVIRAINTIREEGWLVVGDASHRTKETHFRIPHSPKEYMVWRDKLVDDLKTLHRTLLISDQAAKTRFGVDLLTQEFLF